MKISDSLFARAQSVIPGGVNSPVRAFRSVGGTPFFTERADGATLTTVDGDQLVDFVCTWGPAIHGHNPEPVRIAVAHALEKGTSFGTPNPDEVPMAEFIVKHVPSVEKVRMCNSGTEATMSCIRLARGFTGRDKIIKFSGCYHGHVDSLLVSAGSGALTLGNPDSAGIPKSFAAETIVLPYNDFDALDTAFAEYPDQIAGIIVEAYPANCSLVLPKPGYMQKLRDACSTQGALLIMDEVMTGFRIALGGVQEKEQITPDLTAMGKIIGGGLPVGAFGGRKDIMAHLAPEGPVYQAGTLSGNPLAMAAGLASIEKLRDEQPYRLLDTLGKQIQSAVLDAASVKGLPVQVPQTGSMFAILFTDKPVDSFDVVLGSDADRFKQLFHACLKRGVYLPPSAFETCFISTAHAQGAIDQACDVIGDAIRDI
ncbi:MAG: glutamate-1-semialdehyde 2,1-aminomutase [Opitutales bacterium]|nr:glutamate-1-semialdehyde 2,1-aminomutase [Opitutales bacterium]NRA27251.1 glutamate-1-semialdehyde 2,1-aminomutase [Opitutales bacterium]